MGQLDGKVVVVTGAAQGMGTGHAERCVAEGGRVVVTDVQVEPGRAVAERLGDAAMFVAHDVADAGDWERVVAAVTATWGRVDGLVNNAAVYGPPGPLEQETPENFERTWRVNVVGPWLGMRAVLAPLRAAGGGSVVNISSVAGMRGLAGLSTYGTSKWAVRGLTKAAARELGPDGIRVNSVHPGAVDRTGMFAAPDDPGERERTVDRIPLRRVGTPDDVASLVAFLLSDESRWITGTEHVIDGGFIV